ncbi:hypothetical_protein (plasmid) [Leishmania braziliensis MHOM/BR/75/M2904]|uniref:Hypothetical_protein n=1 Tax=Leishmania braziliensis MHOM/BR/75/M2904 TaxID=420245 RepID=A0A3P3Z3S4_LEIBR|nr:hypothetical_protein [Leishmania braziliensis MHOM/BR/75/M2904]
MPVVVPLLSFLIRVLELNLASLLTVTGELDPAMAHRLDFAEPAFGCGPAQALLKHLAKLKKSSESGSSAVAGTVSSDTTS